MGTEHTPGRLSQLCTPRRNIVADCYHNRPVVAFTSKACGMPYDANAARLVACWNACEGIADPAELRAQRDELLAALEAIVSATELDADTVELALSALSGIRAAARAAIASAEGRA